MRKRLMMCCPDDSRLEQEWLELERLAEVELSSEDSAHPIESALLPGDNSGWRAAEPGAQTIRVLFDHPQQLRRIWIRFIEPELTRTQEYLLRWSSDNGRSYHDIVRQQWNFSPPNTTNEVEDHEVAIPAATTLELHIKPDISGGLAFASVAQMRLA
jgi:hypothetical protein